ncbi:MAG: hypothetical protein KDA52_05450 [Planctomycetaceae bacterium]|nr:hypothetical protein [Planctomycetaceae bacterium]
MASTSADKRRWRCPQCNRVLLIPESAADPMVCSECMNQQPIHASELDEIAKASGERSTTNREQSKWLLLAVVAVIGLIVIGWMTRSPHTPKSIPAIVSNGVSAESPASHGQHATIPSDVSYTIINSDSFRDIKRSLDVRLNKRVSEETLRAIALDLKGSDAQSYTRTFIVYYLPGMTVGAGGWATSHFDPNLQVRIIGQKDDEELPSLSTPSATPSDRESIGLWVDVVANLRMPITLYRESGKTYLDMYGSVREVVETRSPQGQVFVERERNATGEFYVINASGALELWDNDGMIRTARKAD